MDRIHKLSGKQIGFALHGYTNDIQSWLNTIINIYNSNGFYFKSVSFDIDYQKIKRMSIKSFNRDFQNKYLPIIDKLYSFNIYYGDNQNMPETWHYRATFDMPSRYIILCFDECYSEQVVLPFYHKVIKSLLENNIVQTGYLFYGKPDYPMGGGGPDYILNYYKENGHQWWLMMNPRNIHMLFDLNDKYRHIYLENILNEKHIKTKINDISLKEWIATNNYGTIKKIGIKNWLWVIPKDKLKEIQIIFYQNKKLLGCE
ncbi:hypothetical protein [Parabacteroides distasonis]|uniref:hypothetical protein n=1 Tax=Parabacteroides distasonis TaxID=823 RepID=UPI002164D543|nr:hypothetical protein [Parabacteroides distasonis]UVR95831.1 hypothetical protein NXX79_21005 [Parabacteroides distasonis]